VPRGSQLKSCAIQLTENERTFPEDDVIVSKTDLKGRITYVNQTFMDVSGYTEEELLGKPHNIIRHPEMPRCVFKLMWDTLEARREIFAYVNNLCKNGDHYWVFAHVTPSFDASGRSVGYHSNRRVPERRAVELFDGLYRDLKKEEFKHPDPKRSMEAGGALLQRLLADKKTTFDEFVFSL
jgi:PAS domain S-box-containing protein